MWISTRLVVRLCGNLPSLRFAHRTASRKVPMNQAATHVFMLEAFQARTVQYQFAPRHFGSLTRLANASDQPGREMRYHKPTIVLYCFAPVGGSASAFRDWSSAFPENIRIRPVELPGRGARSGAPLLSDYRMTVVSRVAEIADEIIDLRRKQGAVHYAAFGHGLGGMLGFAVLSRLSQRLNHSPAHCFLSAALPPHLERPQRSSMGDAVLLDALFDMPSASAGMRDCTIMHDGILPVLRADWSVYEGATVDRHRRLDCPLTLFAADKDTFCSPESVWEWDRYTSRNSQCISLNGDHFSVFRSPETIIESIRSTLDRFLDVRESCAQW